ncbi:AfsR/SARP family transcriptional regulator [Pseudonocardia xishanensis]|uniref:OmpR/PhoB-type domain-containing protein n=1 Tax=Pseudonocardia xishanensis TaxID=630995 RepID=A0ABP8S129_9PSEU
MALRYRDLGDIVVERDGEPVPVVGGRLRTALGLLLVHADRPVSVDALVDALWSGSAPPGAASTVESHVFRLRRVLEPDRPRGAASRVLAHEAAGYRLLAGPDEVDSRRFERLARDAEDLLTAGRTAQALVVTREALGSWRGRPFGELSDEPWAEATVARLEELHGQVRERHVDALLAEGDADAALVELEGALRDHPLREHLWAQRMLACHRAGRPDSALATFIEARTLLLDELGVEPGRELRELHARLLAEDPALDGPRRAPTAPAIGVLLPSRRVLVGRRAEVDRVAEAVARAGLVTVVGPAGCGKTALAVEAARAAAPAFPDGVRFVDLTGARAAEEVLDAVGGAFGLAVPASDAVRAHLGGLRLLLVLDHCGRVLDAVADLADALLSDGAAVTVLATCREPLDVPGETVVPLAPLPPPDPEDPALAQAPAVRLFLDRARLPDADLALVAEICRAVDGLPLAVELAAARTRAFGLPEILAQVTADPSGLAAVGRAHRGLTLRETVAQTVALLNADETAVHAAVSVVSGPFTVELAATLAALPADRTGAAVAGLVHRSLLSPLGPVAPGRPSRFAQLATVRGQAASVAEDPEALHLRRDRWVAELAGALPRLGSAAETTWFARLDDDRAALQATLVHAVVDLPSAAGVAVVGRVAQYLYHRGLSLEARRRLERAVTLDLGTALDRVLVRLALAGFRGLAGEADPDLLTGAADPALRGARPAADPAARGSGVPVPSPVDLLVDRLAVVAGTWLAGVGAEAVAPVLDAVRAVAAGSPDPHTLLLVDVTALLAGRGDAAAVFARGEALDDHFSCWVAAVVAAADALRAGAVEDGLRWTDRLLAAHRSHGVVEAPFLLELRGGLLARAGRDREAVREFGAAHAHLTRAGIGWPHTEWAPPLLAAARAALPEAEADAAWSEGARLGLADLVEARTPR